MSGSTEKTGGNPAQPDRIDFLETSAGMPLPLLIMQP